MSVAEPTLDPIEIRRLFEGHYVVAERMARDRELEKYLVLRSKVEMALLRRLGTEESNHWGEGTELRQGTMEVKLTVGNHLNWPWRSLPPSCPLSGAGYCPARQPLEHCATQLREGRWGFTIIVGKDGSLSPQKVMLHPGRGPSSLNAAEAAYAAQYYQPNLPRIEPTYQEDTKWQRLCQLGEREGVPTHRSSPLIEDLYRFWGEAIKAALHPPVCSFQCLGELGPEATWIDEGESVPPVGPTLLHLWCLLKRFTSEREAVKSLANWFGIRDSLFDRNGWYDGRSNWHQHEEMCVLTSDELRGVPAAGCSFPHIVNGRDRISETIQCDRVNRVALPITAWTRGDIAIRHYLNLPPLAPGLANQPAIRERRDLPVILTDSIEIMEANQGSWRDANEQPLAIWSSWYGEGEAVPLIDWSCLERRTVYYLIAPDPHLPVEEARELAYGTAHAVSERLGELRKTRRVFVDLSLASGQEAESALFQREPTVWTLDQFMALYARHETLRDASATIEGFGPLTMKEISAAPAETHNFLLEPVLAERSTTLMYAKTNLGKTWLALCMGAAIAHGTGLFGRWRARKARKVLYIDSEMDKQSLHRRVKTVARMFFDGKPLPSRHARNFLTESRSRADPGIEHFKSKVARYVQAKKIALVVLDNLTAFTQHNDSAKAWEETHTWIDELKKAGCAVLIIHHENKAGGQRGTSATTNAVDNVLHLVDPNDPKEKKKRDKDDPEPEPLKREGLLMKVRVEKGREIFGEARRAFIVNIVPSAFPPTCSAEGLPEDDKDYEPGCEGLRPAAGGATKRPYRRKGSEREELASKALAELAKGKSVTETARELGISPSWMYNCAKITDRAQFVDAAKEREDDRESRDKRIFVSYREEPNVRRIVQEKGVSETTVRRAIDAGWIAEMQAQEGFSERWPPEKVVGLVKGLDETTARRLLRRLRLDRVPKLTGGAESLGQVAESLSLPLADVERVFRRGQKRELREWTERQRRRNGLEQIGLLHADGKSLEEIKSQVDLPKRTVVEEFNRLQRVAKAEGTEGS